MERFLKPPVGSKITVTTRHADHYRFAKQNYKENTYSGIVVNPVTDLSPDDFEMTGDHTMPTRVINLSKIVNLTINGQPGPTKVAIPQNKTIMIRGSTGNQYVVSFTGNTNISCTCMGFQYRKHCSHIEKALSQG